MAGPWAVKKIHRGGEKVGSTAAYRVKKEGTRGPAAWRKRCKLGSGGKRKGVLTVLPGTSSKGVEGVPGELKLKKQRRRY